MKKLKTKLLKLTFLTLALAVFTSTLYAQGCNPNFVKTYSGKTVSACSATVVNWSNGENNSPENNITYTLSGATTGSGSGEANGLTYNIGTTVVTLTSTVNNKNCNGETAQHSFNIVVDNSTCNNCTAPTISCPSNISVGNDQGKCSAVVTFSATATGTSPTITYSPASGSTFAVGTTTVKATATNSCGTDVCSFDVIVTDNEIPALPCANAAPFIDANGNASVTVSELHGAVTDNCQVLNITASKTSFDCSDLGTQIVIVTATDIHNNVNTCSTWVTVRDYIAPVITCPSDISVNNDAGKCGATINITDATATDNCSIASIVGIRSDNKALTDDYPVGTTTIEWTAKDHDSPDQGANASSCTQTIIVKDNESPKITCAGNQSQTADAGVCNAAVSVTALSTSDNCAVASVSNDYNSTTDASDTYPVGTTTVVWTVTDIHGNSNTCTQLIKVTDNEAPKITCASNQSQTADAGVCKAAVTVSAPSTSDNCGVASVTNDYNSSADASDTYPVGTTTVTWTVNDIHGNTNTCTQLIKVTDNEKPIANCKNYTLNLSGGVGSITANDVNNNSTDNCGITSLSVSPSSFNCSNAGANTVTLTVTDIHGNSSTCTATVTVQYQPTCSIAVTAANNTYTGGVVTNIYLGYGPQSATMTANATGGSGFTYSWSPANKLSSSTIQNPVFTPTAEGNYTYTVTVTNSNGCVTTCTKTFCVKDVQVSGSGGKKVYLCHLPPGNNQNPQTLSISTNAVYSHLTEHSGDALGKCGSTCNSNKKTSVEQLLVDIDNLEITCSPNPFSQSFKLNYISAFSTQATISIFGITGNLIEKTTVSGNSNHVELGQNLPDGIYTVSFIQGDIVKIFKMIKVN